MLIGKFSDNISNMNNITINPKIMSGKPIIKGTRITVELILRLLANGATQNEILKTYPHLTRQDILACLEYATKTLETEKVFTLNIGKSRALMHR